MDFQKLDVFRAVASDAAGTEHRPRGTLLPGCRLFSGAGGVLVGIPEAVTLRLMAFARAAAPKEWLGVVAASAYEDEVGPYVVVHGVVPDVGADSGPASVRSTPESEYRTRKFLRDLYPDATPLGWAHSHPGMGVFFSEQDRRNQATWSDPNALGIVVDPTATSPIAVFRGPRSERLREVAMGTALNVTPSRMPVTYARGPAASANKETTVVADQEATGLRRRPLFVPRRGEPERLTWRGAGALSLPHARAAGPRLIGAPSRPPRHEGGGRVAWLVAGLAAFAIVAVVLATALRRIELIERELHDVTDIVERQSDELRAADARYRSLLFTLCFAAPDAEGIDPPVWCTTELL